eukprot:1886628-Rhodomonas_salina.1
MTSGTANANGLPVTAEMSMSPVAVRRFWPWAVTHWHQIYAYWVKKNGQTCWDGLPSHTFNLAAQWGCYVIGHMSLEHPLVKSDTTHEDRALEGAFLCWDLTTPTFWMWSFRLKQ